MSDTLTIIYTDGAVEVINGCSFVHVVEGVLRFRVTDGMSRKKYHEGRPLTFIKAYRIEGK